MQCGKQNVTSLCGKAITAKKLSTLTKLYCFVFSICFHSAVGEVATRARHLAMENFPISIIFIP